MNKWLARFFRSPKFYAVGVRGGIKGWIAAGVITVAIGVGVWQTGFSDTIAPTVSLTAPAAGTISGTVSVDATASDNVGVTQVDFFHSTTSAIATDSSSPYSVSWNTTGVTNGAYTLTAVARDAAGNSTTSAGVNVTVNNGSTSGTANIWVDTTTGNNSCTRSSSLLAYAGTTNTCNDIDLARDIAQCGDTVGIAPGTYPDVNMSNPTNNCTTNKVRIVNFGTQTATVFDWIDFGSSGTILDNIYIPSTGQPCDSTGFCPSELSNENGIEINVGCNYCQLTNSHSRELEGRDADNVTVGPNNVFDPHADGGNWTNSSSQFWNGMTFLTIIDNYWEDYWTGVPAPGDHGEAINIGGGANHWLIKGNTFFNNGNTSHIFITYFPSTNPQNGCITGNTFLAAHGATFFDINFRQEITLADNVKVDPAQGASSTNPEFNSTCTTMP